MLKHTPFSVFQQYPENNFIQYICSELNNANRVDIVWYQFFDNSLKNTMKDKGDRGIGSKSSPQTAVPSNSKKNSKKKFLKKKSKNFLRNSKNKIELLDFVTKTLSGYQFGTKEVHITKGNTISTVAVIGTNLMDIAHEKADTRLMMHLLDAAEKAMKANIIRKVDSYIRTIVLGKFKLITQIHSYLSVCVRSKVKCI